MASIIVESVPVDSVGVATGVNANLRSIGQAVGSALMSAMVFGSLDAHGAPVEDNYVTAWLTISIIGLFAAALVVAVRTGRRTTAPAEPEYVEAA
jgi:hypothetical protein